VHIKRVELTNFKSFGGKTDIPLLPGFTVVSGPNGSGKSNILDALLFALGLSGSKGMRAERLPDLVNHQQMSKTRSTIETSVTVTFELDEVLSVNTENDSNSDGNSNGNGQTANGAAPELSSIETSQNGNGTNGTSPALSPSEWQVTRKLRVTPQGTYTSTYAMNGEACTLNDLHDRLQTLRVYPEGYNVVLQGDVTSIISMNPRERREIIDELAGVAAFDRKIVQAKDKLDAVKERQDTCRIVENELIEQRDRLAKDRVIAEKYQKLRAELQDKSSWETVILYRQAQERFVQLQNQFQSDAQQAIELDAQITTTQAAVQQAAVTLDEFNQKVRALGEGEYLTLQSTLAGYEAQRQQLQHQQAQFEQTRQTTRQAIAQTENELTELAQTLVNVQHERDAIEAQDLASVKASRQQAQTDLDAAREAASRTVAEASAWVEQQTTLNQQVQQLQQQVEPQRREQAQLQERVHQLQRQIQEATEQLEPINPAIADKQTAIAELEVVQKQAETLAVEAAQSLAAAEEASQMHQQTQIRLQQEQRDKQRQLDKLEAQAQAQQESQGTQATKIILQASIPGVCGLVAQLGSVEPQYQLALEVAAGGRLSNIVVEDDAIATAGIELLKQRKGGRATFLPLNKIQAPKLVSIPAWQQPTGFIDYAVRLVDFEPRYETVFGYVMGSTLIFDTINHARQYIGQYRMVTLDGELLETTGALTGGSFNNRSPLHFGGVADADSPEIRKLQVRLHEIEEILLRCEREVQASSSATKARSQQLTEARQQHRDAQLRLERLQSELNQLLNQKRQLDTQLTQQTQEASTAEARLHAIAQTVPAQETQLAELQQTLNGLEQSQTHQAWQQAQENIRVLEAQLNGWELVQRNTEQKLQTLETQRQLALEKQQQAQQRLSGYQTQITQEAQQQTQFASQMSGLHEQIQQTQTAIAQLDQTLGSTKQERDQAEQRWRDLQNQQQQLQWRLEKIQTAQTERQTLLEELQVQLIAQQNDLPDPIPEVPDEVNLEQLQQEVRSLQKRIQAMEPVNMLALEEYEKTQARLEDLTERLGTLESERTELLLRIENFTTLRQQAFKEAFDAVNRNFQDIFATLSDGDGHLQLDDDHDPFSSGLNLVAHPKGKPVQRLASMSGGEKSLTALSFIFALQRYRPSPFYAFDEVDMFLDGANVERLSKMIKHQATQAQFIVVSLRRPMIEASERTIGVTQARGTHTQVLGLAVQDYKTASSH
jgi:chromosome segregation protein